MRQSPVLSGNIWCDHIFAGQCVNEWSLTEQKNPTVCPHACYTIGLDQLSISSPVAPLTWQHVVTLNEKHSSACKYPSHLLPHPHQSTSLQFSIKIQTEIDDLKDTAGYLTTVHRCSRHLKGLGGVVYWVTVNSDHPHLSKISHICAKLCLPSYHRSRLQDSRCRCVLETLMQLNM